MLDPRSLAERRDEIVENCRRRGLTVDVDGAVGLAEDVARIQTELNELNRKRNDHQAAGKRKLSPEEREAHVAEGRRLKEAGAGLEARLGEARSRLEEALSALPNFSHPDVPVGGEDDYVVLHQHGEPPHFGFPPRDHLEICAAHDLLDLEAGAKVCGQKWIYLKNDLVLLDLALQRYALGVLIDEGFTPVATPDVARPQFVEGTGYSPRGPETQIYSLENADLCLIGTAEITLGGMLADDILEEDALPLKLAGVSHCFRTEAGSAGRESKGLYRIHQFSKVEMFAYTRPEDSEAMHAEMLRIEERIFQDLEVPYRVIDTATGDLGAPAYRKFDLEAWMVGRGEAGDWGEVTSTSNCTDFQARRLRIRFKRKDTRKNELVHTLNGTAVATSRAIIAILENHQRADGAVSVPKALRPWFGRDVLGGRA